MPPKAQTSIPTGGEPPAGPPMPPALQLIGTYEQEGRHLLRTASGRYLKVAPSICRLLMQRNSGSSFADIAKQWSEKAGREIEPQELEAAYRRIVEHLGKIEETDNLTRSGFWLRLTLIPERWVQPIAAVLSRGFHPRVVYPLLLFIAVALTLVSTTNLSVDFNTSSFGQGYLLLLFSLLLHEFGHASACARHGAKPRTIGFGVYLLYPVFYSDVSPAWELNRRQRVTVDVGGLYFQSVVGAVYALVYYFWQWEAFKVGLLMIAASSVFSLNPIFKFDGYWILADSLGITNLSQQPSRVIRHFWGRLRGKPTEPLPWSAAMTAFMTVYSVLSFSVWFVFLFYMLPFFLDRIVAYPASLLAVLRDSVRAGQPVEAGRLGALLVSTYLCAIAIFMVYRMGSGLVTSLYPTIHKLWTKACERIVPPHPSDPDSGEGEAEEVAMPLEADVESAPASTR